MDYIVARSFNFLYIYFDIIWLLIFAGIIIYKRKYTALVVGLIFGIVYFIVDYGIFYHALGTREVNGADTFWLLFWLSMSYGFTNFAWIWLLLDRDGHDLEWSMIPILGWITVSLMSQNFGYGFQDIMISRKIGSYHGVMALMMTVGYVMLIIRNLKESNPKQKAPILRLLAIGIGVQLAWESVLLITGVRPLGFKPLIINSLIETNLGLPYIWLIHKRITGR